MSPIRTTLLLLTLGASSLSLVACGGKGRQEQLAYVEKPVEQIYTEATRSLD